MAELNNTGAGQWSETDASNTSASPDGWPSGTYLNQAEPIGRATMGAIKRFWDRINGTVSTSGSANGYVYTPVNTSFPTAYVAGEIYTFKANFTNTGAATLNLNSLGAKNIYKQSGAGPVALTGGEIVSGQFYQVSYDGTQFQILGSGGATSTLTGAVTGTGTGSIATVFGSIATGNIIGNITGSSASPVAITANQLLDNAYTTTQGAVLYRTTSNWAALLPGTAGQVLQTNGSSVDPSWALPKLFFPSLIGGSTTLTQGDTLAICDTSGGNLNLTLPDASLAGVKGREIVIVKVSGANTLTIIPSGTQAINGVASATLTITANLGRYRIIPVSTAEGFGLSGWWVSGT